MHTPPPPVSPPGPPPSSPPPDGFHVDPSRLDRNWRAITIELDTPHPSRLERLLRRLGVRSHITRLVVATPALRRAWFVALGLVVFIGVGLSDAAEPRASMLPLLLLAPLIPVLGVALAYGTPGDPGHEVHLATPMSGLRLLTTRAAVVMAVATPVVVLSALLSEVSRPWAIAWVIPASAVTGVAVALMTITTPNRAVAIASVVWVFTAFVARAAANDELAAFVPAAQVASLLVAMSCAAITFARRDELERLAT